MIRLLLSALFCRQCLPFLQSLTTLLPFVFSARVAVAGECVALMKKDGNSLFSQIVTAQMLSPLSHEYELEGRQLYERIYQDHLQREVAYYSKSGSHSPAEVAKQLLIPPPDEAAPVLGLAMRQVRSAYALSEAARHINSITQSELVSKLSAHGVQILRMHTKEGTPDFYFELMQGLRFDIHSSDPASNAPIVNIPLLPFVASNPKGHLMPVVQYLAATREMSDAEIRTFNFFLRYLISDWNITGRNAWRALFELSKNFSQSSAL